MLQVIPCPFLGVDGNSRRDSKGRKSFEASFPEMIKKCTSRSREAKNHGHSAQKNHEIYLETRYHWEFDNI